MGGIYTDSILCLNQSLYLIAYFVGEDLHVSVFGGDRPHIGAVSILSPDGNIQTLCFDGHRDDTVSAIWIEALKSAGVHAGVVEAGIHYDAITKDGIASVLEACDKLLSGVLNYVKTVRHSHE